MTRAFEEFGDLFGEDNVAQWANLAPEEEPSSSVLSPEAIASNARIKQKEEAEQVERLRSLPFSTADWS